MCCYSRFLLENIAFFEYVTIGEVQTTVATLEKTFTSTGAIVAQAIEAEIFQVRMDALESGPAGEAAQISVATAGSSVDSGPPASASGCLDDAPIHLGSEDIRAPALQPR